ncbi:MAG: thioredoxin domain-containing protein, partial [Betaproteobacteria bacterium]|nr:thioredoxin domain-containing protein [Betaproteobacteria bacterium]
AFATRLADVLLEQFEDHDSTNPRGGFFFTSHDHESLIQRPKPGFDNATPSGNGVAAYALQRLGHLCGEMRCLQAAERALACFAPQIDEHPSGHGSLLMALDEALAPPALVILTGDDAGCRFWQRELARQYRPATMVVAIGGSAPDRLPAVLQKPQRPGVQAWVCHGLQCAPPVADLVQLQQSLSGAPQ